MSEAAEGRHGPDGGSAALLPVSGSSSALCFLSGGFVHLRLRSRPVPSSAPLPSLSVVISADRQMCVLSISCSACI